MRRNASVPDDATDPAAAGLYSLCDGTWPKAVPGRGWLVRADARDPTQVRVLPVVAWLIDEDGTGDAIVFGDDGVVQPASDLGGRWQYNPTRPERAPEPAVRAGAWS